MRTSLLILLTCALPGQAPAAEPPRLAGEEQAADRLKGPGCDIEWARVGRWTHVVGITFSSIEHPTRDDLRQLLAFRQLSRADFTGCRVSGKELAGLRGHPTLKTLILDATALDDAGLAHCKTLPRLEVLSAFGMQVTDAGVRALEGMSRLRKLGLADTRISDDALRSLRRLPGLRSLDVSGTDVTDRGMAHLRGLPLEELDVGYTKITDRGIRVAAGLAKLYCLRLDCTRVTDRGAESLARCGGLILLSVECTYLTDSGLLLLTRCRRLEVLLIGGESMRISNDGMRAVAALPRLEKLSLKDSRVTDGGLAHLAKCRLVYLNLQESPISDGGAPALSRITTLTELYLDGTKMSEGEIEALGLALPKTMIHYAYLFEIKPTQK